LDDLIKIAHT